MPMSVIRFDMRAPGRGPAEIHELYGAALEMGRWADEAGLDMLVLSEHHGSEDGYLSSPLVMAGAMGAATKRIPMNISALLVPLHDPVRLAEDIAVVDQVSGGRISIVAGLGYRPEEYVMFDREWKRRGRRMDECLDVMIKAWTGEPFEYRGETIRVTPRPVQQPHPLVFVGGSGPKAAERAARFQLGFMPPVGDDELVALYNAECERLGHDPGMVLMPTATQPGMVTVAEDPDKAWAELGPYYLHDAMVYKSWQGPDQRSLVASEADSVEALREEGVYTILTPDECVRLAGDLGPLGAIVLHPLCGGVPPELAWPGLELFASAVMPRLNAAS